jgi:hypothetical protein
MHQKEQRSVIGFSSNEGVKPIEIHLRVKVQYSDACLSLQQAYEWTRKFIDGIRSDEEVQQAVHEWMRSQPKEFFSRRMHALPKRWNTCMESKGENIKKLSHCVPFVCNKLRDKNI